MRWEVRGLWHDPKLSKSSTRYDDRAKAYEAFDAMVRSDPTWLELYETEDGKEPKRLRRYELPRMLGKRGRDDLRRTPCDSSQVAFLGWEPWFSGVSSERQRARTMMP
jgi:hypothetical protein